MSLPKINIQYRIKKDCRIGHIGNGVDSVVKPFFKLDKKGKIHFIKYQGDYTTVITSGS